MLDNLPPLDLPRDRIPSEVKTAAIPKAESDPAPTEIPVEVSAEPGLKRFAAVEPKLAGGSLPAADGLDWLSEKGYKTLLDLREPAEVERSFLADVSRRGLRYVSLPVSLTIMDRNNANRFEFEIALTDALPLYFFDADGNRAGMLWYVHRMTDKKAGYDDEEALRQAGELGLVDRACKKAAQAYLDGLKKSAVRPPAAASTPAQPPPPAAAAPKPVVTDVPAPTATPDQTASPGQHEPIALPDPATLDLARETPPALPPAPRDVSLTGDPNAWRPYLALVFAMLGVPAAYCSRSLIQFRGLVRASLPKPARRLRSLPSGSGD
jgi:hypothetical protein